MRDVIMVQSEHVFKGQLLALPSSLRKELMTIVYGSDIGIAGCIRRASDSLYWARMSTDLKEYISKYDICLAHRCTQGDEPNMYSTNSWHDPIPSLELICTNLTTVQS